MHIRASFLLLHRGIRMEGGGVGLKEDIVIRLSKGGCVSLQTGGLQAY